MTRRQSLLIAAAARLSDRTSLNALDLQAAVRDALKLETEVLRQAPDGEISPGGAE